jgi:hypothetical protein
MALSVYGLSHSRMAIIRVWLGTTIFLSSSSIGCGYVLGAVNFIGFRSQLKRGNLDSRNNYEDMRDFLVN